MGNQKLIDILLTSLNEDVDENGVYEALLLLNNLDLSQEGTYYMLDVVIILRVINRIFASNNVGRNDIDSMCNLMRSLKQICLFQQYSEKIRCLACKIFLRIVSDAAQEDPDLIQRHLQPAVSSFCAAFVPSWTSGGGSRLKIHILNTVGMLMEYIPKDIVDFLPDMIPLVWGTLIDRAKDYQVNVVNRVERNRNGIESVADEEESCSTDLVKATLKFIKQLMNGEDRSNPSHKLYNHEWISLQDSYVPPHALRHLIMLMEVTEEQIEQWNTDTDEFVEREETQKLDNDGIRRVAQEIIEIIRGQNRLVAKNLMAEIIKYLKIEKTMRNHGQTVICQKCWKSLEAFLQAFVLMKEIIISRKDEQLDCFLVQSILRTVVLADLKNPASHPLLVGRCLTVGGMYADQMPKESASAFLKATAAGLQENRPVCVKICAAKAVYLWCYQNNSRGTSSTTLLFYVPNLFEGLFNLAKNCKSAGVYMLVVKSIASLMPFDKTYTASVSNCICTLTETALPQYHLTGFSQSVLNVYKELMLNPGCTQVLQQKLTPILISMMANTPSDKYTVAIDIVTLLVEHPSLSMRYFLNDTLFPAACNYIVRADKWWLQCRGIKMIHKYLSMAFHQVVNFRDKYGENGAECIVKVIVHVLNHKYAILKMEEICEVLILLIEEAHHKMGENIDGLLRTLLNHLRKEKSSYNSRRILMVFAYLVRAQSNVVLNFLANTRGLSEPKSSLELLISQGFCREYYIVEGNERETMKFALGKILEHGVTNLSSPLHHIKFEEVSGQTIPLLAKICKMIIHDQSCV